jgi:hypothetical protein
MPMEGQQMSRILTNGESDNGQPAPLASAVFNLDAKAPLPLVELVVTDHRPAGRFRGVKGF